MKIIIHLGTAKTGTTSLQVGLWTIRNDLLKEGYFYPVGPRPKHNHHILLGLYEVQQLLLGFQVNEYGSLENLTKAAVAFLAGVKNDAKANGCHTIVLSSELLFPRHRLKDFGKLMDHLRAVSTDIVPVVYVREAAALYKSRLQQAARTGRFLRPANQVPLQHGFEKVE